MTAARGLALAAAWALGFGACSTPRAPLASEVRAQALAETPRAGIETGTHWAGPEDYPLLASLGYDFVVTTLRPGEPEVWKQTFDAAERHGLRLIAGLYPEPYRRERDRWVVSAEGLEFLRFAASRDELVKALWVFNEPYWIDPFSGKGNLCGALSSNELRELRETIREVWPQARVYHDLGLPSSWAPGGELTRWNPCIRNKFADQTGVADFVGIWNNKFNRESAFDLPKELDRILEEVEFVRREMRAEPIFALQSYRCEKCGGEADRMPTPEEFRAWHCATRRLRLHGISFYVWRQELYAEALADRPDYWNLSRPAACAP